MRHEPSSAADGVRLDGLVRHWAVAAGKGRFLISPKAHVLGFHHALKGEWLVVEDDKDAIINKVAAHAAKAHNIKNADKDKILGKTKEPANPDLECDITAKDEGREEDPGCAISG